MNEGAPLKTGWLFGAGSDLVLGCGLGSMAVMLAQVVVGPSLPRLIPGALLILLFALPHYGATLIRAYEDPADRSRYRVFSLWATLVVGSCFLGSLYLPALGSLVLTIYLTWSPWHYTGQNYGIALMLLARRGVRVSPLAKRFLYASFVLSFGLTFLAIHGEAPQDSYAPVSYGGTIFELLAIGIPQGVVGLCIGLLGTAYVIAFVMSVVLLTRSGGLRAILPGVTLMLTQALWFSLPVAIRHFELAAEGSVFRSVYTAYGFLWIAAYHSIQYLWITTYYATQSATQSGPAVRRRPSALACRLRFLGKATLVGYAVWTLPALVVAPGLLTGLPHESGLALMVAATVNLHHFILDGAIWKLRDGRVARILLKVPGAGAPRASPGETRSRPSPWRSRLVYGLGAACLAYGVVTYWADDMGFSQALSRGDIQTARQAIEKLKWLGRDGPSRHTELGRRLARQGEDAAALVEFRRSVELNPTVRAWKSIALLFEQRREWQSAASAYDSVLALQPDDASMLFRVGRAWLEAGRPENAIEPLERAAVLAPGQKLIGLNLARARRESEAHSQP
jgi:hypothetical protein